MKNPLKFQRIGFWQNSQPWVKAFIKHVKGLLPVLWNQYLNIINKRKREIEINQTLEKFRDIKYLSCEMKENTKATNQFSAFPFPSFNLQKNHHQYLVKENWQFCLTRSSCFIRWVMSFFLFPLFIQWDISYMAQVQLVKRNLMYGGTRWLIFIIGHTYHFF